MERRSPILIHCLKKKGELTTLSFLFGEGNEYVSAAVRPLRGKPVLWGWAGLVRTSEKKKKKFVEDAESRI